MKEMTEKRRDQDEKILNMTIEIEKLKSTVMDHDQTADKTVRENSILEGKLKIVNQKVEIMERREKNLELVLEELREENLRLKRDRDAEERKVMTEKAEKAHVNNTNLQQNEEIEKLNELL